MELTAVRDLAKLLDVPLQIQLRTSTTDTFGLTQSQEDYYYGISPKILSAFAHCSGFSDAESICTSFSLDVDSARAIWGIALSMSHVSRYNQVKASLRPVRSA